MSKKTEYVTETPRCLQIVARLEREIVVAVATEGVNVSKEGPLTLLQIGTCSGTVYVFDVLLNRELINNGRLRAILENEKIVKVNDLSRLMTKTNKMGVRPAKTQISLGIRPVWSVFAVCAQWLVKEPRFLHVDSEDSD